MRAIIAIVCCLLNLLSFILTKHNYFLLFATNDDYCMRLIVFSGYTGTPSSQAVSLGAILSHTLAVLYRIKPQWSGTALILLLFCSLIHHLPRSWLTYIFLQDSYLYAFACLIGLVFRGRMVLRISQSANFVLAAISTSVVGHAPCPRRTDLTKCQRSAEHSVETEASPPL